MAGWLWSDRSAVADWRALVNPVELREYDRFGPWIDAVESEADMPRRFRPYYSEVRGARYLLKIPRDIDRDRARPGMDLYAAVLAVHDDRVCLLRLTADGVRRSEAGLDRVVAVSTEISLLLGRWSLLCSDGSTIALEFSSPAAGPLKEVTGYVRSRFEIESGRPWLAPVPIPGSAAVFASTLAELERTSLAPVTPLHVEPGNRACRDELGRRRLSTGAMLLDTAAELVLVNRGPASRSRLAWGHYDLFVTFVPYSRLTSFSVLEPARTRTPGFHQLVLRADRHVIRQPCLTRPDVVAATLTGRGVREHVGAPDEGDAILR